jgi:acetyl esterase
MPLDPFLQDYIRRKSSEPRVSDLDVAGARASKASSRMQVWPAAAPCTTRDVEIPMSWGACAARLYDPGRPGPLPLVVFFHGGGFVICDLDTHDGLARGICGGAGVAVLSVGYRLAPEHPYPAGLEDAVASIVWAVAQADALGIDSGRLVLCGDSAGGSIAAATALRLADDADAPRLMGLALCYPVLDRPDAGHASYVEFAEGYGLTRRDMEWFWRHYGGGDAAEAAPLRVSDLRRCPPAFIMTAQYDPLRDEGEAFAARLFRESVLVNGRRVAGVNHNFLAFSESLPAAAEAMTELCGWISTRTR